MSTKKHSGLKALCSCLLAIAMAFGLSVNAAAAQVDTDDTTATVVFEDGVLELVSVPNLTFATTQLSAGNYTISLSNADEAVSVSDMRSVYGEWQLTMALSNFSHAVAGSDSLSDTSIKVLNAPIDGPPVPDAEKATCGATIEAFCDDPAEEVAVMEAATGAGYGVWSSDWASATTTLEIPAAVTPYETGTHTARLDWYLTNGV